MALTYGYFDHINHVPGYHADDINYMFNGVIRDGIFQNAAIYNDNGVPVANNKFCCTLKNSKIKVATGKAIFDGIWIINNSVITLTPSATDYYVVIEIDKRITKRTVSIKIINSTKLQNGPKIFQYGLAKVSGTTNVTQLVNTQYYVVTPDTSFRSNKNYYELVSGSYVITSDTSMQSGKTYYEIKRSFYVENLLELPNLKIRNDLTITEKGYVLDARQGKVISDKTPFSFAIKNKKYGYMNGNKFVAF